MLIKLCHTTAWRTWTWCFKKRRGLFLVQRRAGVFDTHSLSHTGMMSSSCPDFHKPGLDLLSRKDICYNVAFYVAKERQNRWKVNLQKWLYSNKIMNKKTSDVLERLKSWVRFLQGHESFHPVRAWCISTSLPLYINNSMLVWNNKTRWITLRSSFNISVFYDGLCKLSSIIKWVYIICFDQ